MGASPRPRESLVSADIHGANGLELEVQGDSLGPLLPEPAKPPPTPPPGEKGHHTSRQWELPESPGQPRSEGVPRPSLLEQEGTPAGWPSRWRFG